VCSSDLGITLSLRYFPQFLNLPNRDYWLAPERREQTAAYLTAHTAWLAALLGLFALAVHLLVVRANQSVPPRLETGALLAALLAFSIVMLAWVAALARRFRRD
jgi:serine/threonine-protein kinase